MTREEYDEVRANLNSDDPYLRLQAEILISILPTHDTQIKYNPAGVDSVETKLRAVLGSYCIDN